MSFLDEPIRWDDPRADRLRQVMVQTLQQSTPAVDFLASAGLDRTTFRTDGPMVDVWTSALETAARQRLLRRVAERAVAVADFAWAREELEALLAAGTAPAGGESIEEHCATPLVGRRPFVDRAPLRDNLKLLFTDGADRVMIVNGPRGTGRSYTWVLASYVAQKANSFPITLVDLSRFVDAQVTPVDVALMIAGDLGWEAPPVDATAQEATKARLLISWIKQSITGRGPACLVFDGLDGANVAPATLQFVSDVAVAAGNDELGGCRVILLAFAATLPNPAVDPFVLRGPPLGDIPLAELVAFVQQLARRQGVELTEDQARAALVSVFGAVPPDPLPVTGLQPHAKRIGELAAALPGLIGG